jgi:hypothetical protein
MLSAPPARAVPPQPMELKSMTAESLLSQMDLAYSAPPSHLNQNGYGVYPPVRQTLRGRVYIGAKPQRKYTDTNTNTNTDTDTDTDTDTQTH